MGFFDEDEQQSRKQLSFKGLGVDFLHKSGCTVCPLNTQNDVRHPHMEPTGVKHPDVYMLGEFPSKKDDKEDQHYAGYLGEIIRMRIPSKWDQRLRWNHVVRTRTPDGRPPSPVEVECCRPSIIKDIEQSKPRAIFGFGAVALHWAVQEMRIDAWVGRSIPIKVGNHKCWFFPMYPPEKIEDTRRFEPKNARAYGSDIEFKFALDMRRAFASIDHLPEPIIHTREEAVSNIKIITGRETGDLERVLDYIDSCYDEKVVGLDYETNKLRPYMKDARILTASLARRDDAMAWAFTHRTHGWTAEELNVIGKAWRRFLLKSKCRKVSHHLGFEAEWSGYCWGRDTAMVSTWECSMSQAYLIDERQKTHGLDTLCLQYYGLPVKDLFVLNRKDMESEKLETILLYNGVDAKYHRALYFKQRATLKKRKQLDVYAHHVGRVQAATMTTMKGVPVNPDVVEDNFDKYERDLARIEKEILGMSVAREFENRKGRPLRPSNNQDVVFVLRKIKGISLNVTENKKRRNTKVKGTINYSTTEDAMMKLEDPFARAIIRWRKVSKLLGTYVIPVRQKNTVLSDGKVHETQLYPDGKLHPTIATTKTRTWRTSSEDPNIQNWPKRGPSKVIRKQITVSDEKVIVAIDYGGIQARNVGMESRDKGLLKHYWDRYDIHSDWLERLLRKVPDWMPPKSIGKNLSDKDKQKEQRSVVKNAFVFPSFFGALGKSVAGTRYLGVDEHIGVELSEEFFDEFPDVKAWHKSLHKFFDEHGYVTGLSEFRRHAPIERNQLINAPIQADESIIVCGAWHRLCLDGDPRCVPNWMVHDDLSFIWRKKELDEMLAKVIPIMLEQVHEWERVIPMEIEIGIGTNWCDLKEIGKFETRKGGGWHQVAGDYHSDRWDYKVGKQGIVGARLRND